METKNMESGGYRYIPGVKQYSAGVAALPGYRIERARFSRPVPIKDGFDLIGKHLESIGRPLTAFCACELRSPGQFSEEGFIAFNEAYTSRLREWQIMSGDDNPVGRANVCPEFDVPAEPSFYAFAYTVEDKDAAPSFVIAGSGEAPEGKGNYQDHIVRLGELSTDAMREKAQFVLDEMERRMAHFDAGWADTTAVQVYCVHDFHPFIREEMGARGVLRSGITWYFNRPPVMNLEFEMDCRRVTREFVLEA